MDRLSRRGEDGATAARAVARSRSVRRFAPTRLGVVVVEVVATPMAALLGAVCCPAVDGKGVLVSAGRASSPNLDLEAAAQWALGEVRAGRVDRWALLLGAAGAGSGSSPQLGSGTRCEQPMAFLEWLRNQRELVACHGTISAYLGASDPDFLFDELPSPFPRDLGGASGGEHDVIACPLILEWGEDETRLVTAVLPGGRHLPR